LGIAIKRSLNERARRALLDAVVDETEKRVETSLHARLPVTPTLHASPRPSASL
jgi:hypothetical protein